MRYQSTEEAQNEHVKSYRSDGYEKGKGLQDSVDLYRINFVLLHVANNSHVLDVGCNGGTLSIPLKEKNKCRVKGIDIVPELVEKAKKRGVFAQVGTAESLPFNENTFDHVVCTEVLEHLYDPRIAVLEAYRVLKNGGSYIVTVPNADSPIMCDEKLGDFHHQNFTKNQIESLIRSVFVDCKMNMYGIAYNEYYCELQGIDKNQAQWIGVEVFKNA